MGKKIRFLATGDIHSDKKIINKIAKNVDFNGIDYILLVGDISEKNNDFGQILGLFKGKPIFMTPGNHETKKKIDVLEKHYGVHMIGDNHIKINDNLVIFGTNYVNLGINAKSEQEIFEDLFTKHKNIKSYKSKIMLSHVPPVNTVIGDSSIFFPFIGGSEGLRVFLEHHKIDLTLVGHIHESSGLEELVSKEHNNKVLNVGQTFKIIEFDIESGKISIIN